MGYTPIGWEEQNKPPQFALPFYVHVKKKKSEPVCKKYKEALRSLSRNQKMVLHDTAYGPTTMGKQHIQRQTVNSYLPKSKDQPNIGGQKSWTQKVWGYKTLRVRTLTTGAAGTG